jgi:hypothetical protein
MGGSTLAGAGRGGAGCGRLLVIQHLRYFRFLPHGHLSFLATIAATFSPCYHVRFSFAIGKHETSANTMTVSRAHHYVPVFYLKGFTSPKDREYLWVYEQGKSVRKSKPVNEAHERDFYTYEDEDGTRRDLEQPLSGIESTMAPLFRIIDDNNFRFHPEEFAALTMFISLMWVRGPFGRDLVSQLSAQVLKSVVMEEAADPEKFKKTYDDFLQKSSTTTEISAEEIRGSLLKDDWEVQHSPGYTLHKMFAGVPVINRILQKKDWQLLIAEGNDYFCTSDFPVVNILPDRPGHAGQASIGTGFGRPGVEIFFPLTRRTCLLLKDRTRRNSKMVPGGMVREINKFLMVGARRFIYACEKNNAMEKLFNKIGCKSVPGENAFMRDSAAEPRTNQL